MTPATGIPAPAARPAPAGPDAGVAGAVPAPGRFRSQRRADRAMRRVLGVRSVDLASGAGAHRAFRLAVVVSAVRCVITYVAIPVLVPVLSLGGWVAGPVGIALCAVAAVNGVLSLRRFWRADHRHRWTYTVFVLVVFAVLAASVLTELGRLGVTA